MKSAALLLCALSASGCLSPTLPLPPPEVDTIFEPQNAGDGWTISGTCTKGALVTVFNEQTGRGVVVEDRDLDGKFTVLLDATKCDLAWAKQEIGDDASGHEMFPVEAKSSSGPSLPIDCK